MPLPVTPIESRHPVRDAVRISRHADRQQACSKRLLAENEGRPAGRAALLSIRVGKDDSFAGDAVDVRRAVAHQAAGVRTDLRSPMSSPKITRMFGFVAVFAMSHLEVGSMSAWQYWSELAMRPRNG